MAMLFIGLMVGWIIGFVLCMFIFAYGQLKLEESYVEQGIAKINRKLYKITPIRKEDE